MTDVLVVGSYVQDLAFRTAVFPVAGETRIGSFVSGPGGKGFNQAVASHRQEISTHFIGAVGKDVFAAGLGEFIDREKITVSLQEVSSKSTGVASIVVNNEGQNQIIVDLGANNYLEPEFVEQKFGSPKVVLAQVESNIASAQRALEIARSKSAFTILNPAPINSDITFKLLQLADLITPNETEFIFLQSHLFGNKLKEDFWKSSDSELLQLCRTFQGSAVILTLGENGCFVALKGQSFRISPIAVKVKDTTGAGDAFSGGLAAGIVKYNGDIVKAAQFGTVVAGLSTQREGTAPAMPSKKAVEERFLREFNV